MGKGRARARAIGGRREWVSVDGAGIVIFAAGLVLYFASKRKAFFLFVSGVGAGILIGAIWAYNIVSEVLQ